MNELEQMLKELDGLSKYPLEEYQFLYKERYDVKILMFFDKKMMEWTFEILEESPQFTCETEKEYDFRKMVIKDEKIFELLPLLPKKYSYIITLKIPELYETTQTEIYPNIKDNEVGVKIVDVFDNGKMIEAPFNKDVMDLNEIFDIENLEQLKSILINLDYLGSSYEGIEARHAKSSTTFYINCLSARNIKTLENFLLLGSVDYEMIHGDVFELIKQQQATILTDFYADFKDEVEHILNVVIKKVFDYFETCLSLKEDVELKHIAYMPTNIQEWYSSALNKKTTKGNMSDNILLWKEMIMFDVEYTDIKVAFNVLKNQGV